jgi:hypothetical protein
MFALRGLWWVIGLFFKKSPLELHVLFIPTFHWTILQPFIFVDVQLWVELETIVMLLELFNP